MGIRGIRGAVDVAANTKEAIAAATQTLLRRMVEANGVNTTQIVSVFFTVTTDLNADYPAAAARSMGWTTIPLLDAQEMEVPGGLPRVIRVLMHVESDKSHDQIEHVYLGAAQSLRPDWRK